MSQRDLIGALDALVRLVDTANQYFLWCNVDPAFRFLFGFTERNVRAEEGAAA